MNTTTEQLAEQLRELKLEHPQPGAVTARVLAAAARPAPRWRPSRLAITVALLLAVLPVSWGVLYFSPATAAVIAASGLGGFPGEMLDGSGLGTGSFTAQSASATSSGYTVQLVGAYSDSIRTVFLFQMTPAAFASGYMHLTDQFGTFYPMQGGEGNLDTGYQAFSFEPPSGLALITGMRFTLSLDQLSIDQRPQKLPRYVSGTWILKGVVLPSSGTKLAVPADGALGGGTVKFVDARYVGRAVLIRADVRGVSLAGDAGVEGPKNRRIPRFQVDFIAIDGSTAKIPPNSRWSSSDGDATQHVQILVLDVDPGTYRFTLALAGVGTLTRTLVVRS